MIGSYSIIIECNTTEYNLRLILYNILLVKEEISLRDGCDWLENYTGRSITPMGLKKIIDRKYGTRQERLGIIS